MTTLGKTIIGATLVVAIGAGVYEARQAAIARAQVQTGSKGFRSPNKSSD